MSQVVRVLLLVGLVGCDGTAGEQGPVGPQGPPGESGYWWVDATGARVAPYGSDRLIDADEYVWRFDPDAGEAGVQSASTFYDSADCTGDAFVDAEAMRPREIFHVLHEEENTMRSCADDAAWPEARQPGSERTSPTNCNTAIEYDVRMVPLEDCPVEATGGVPTWTMPLHIAK
jgi:hypothetical protein